MRSSEGASTCSRKQLESCRTISLSSLWHRRQVASRQLAGNPAAARLTEMLRHGLLRLYSRNAQKIPTPKETVLVSFCHSLATLQHGSRGCRNL